MIEVEQEINHHHSGSIDLIHRSQLLDLENVPLIVRRLLAACVENPDFEIPPELEEQIRSVLPMNTIIVEPSEMNRSKAIGPGSPPRRLLQAINS